MSIVVEKMEKELLKLEVKEKEILNNMEKAKLDLKNFEKELKKNSEEILVKKFDIAKDGYEENREDARRKRKEMKEYLKREKTDDEMKKINTLKKMILETKDIGSIFQEEVNILVDVLSSLNTDEIASFKERISWKKEWQETIKEESHLHYFLLETEMDTLKNTSDLKEKELWELKKIAKNIERNMKEAKNVTIGMKHLSSTLKEIQENMTLRKYFVMEDDELQLFIDNHKKKLKEVQEHIYEKEKIQEEKKTKLEKEVKRRYLIKKETKEGKEEIRKLSEKMKNVEKDNVIISEVYEKIFQDDAEEKEAFFLLFYDALGLLSLKDRIIVLGKFVENDDMNEFFGSKDEIFELMNDTAMEFYANKA